MFIVASPSGRADPSRAASEVYTRIAGAVRDAGMEIVHERIFGSLGVEQAVMAARAVRSMSSISGKSRPPASFPTAYLPRASVAAGVEGATRQTFRSQSMPPFKAQSLSAVTAVPPASARRLLSIIMKLV